MLKVLSVLELDIHGDPLQLLVEGQYQGDKNSKELLFEIAPRDTRNYAHWPPKDTTPTTHISSPFGIDALTINDFRLAAMIETIAAHDDVEAKHNISAAMGAQLIIGTSVKHTVNAGVMFSSKSADLVIAAMPKGEGIGLTDLIIDIFGVDETKWHGCDDDFKLSSGKLYYSRGAKFTDRQLDLAKRVIKPNIFTDGFPQKCRPDLNVSTELKLFDHVLKAELGYKKEQPKSPGEFYMDASIDFTKDSDNNMAGFGIEFQRLKVGIEKSSADRGQIKKNDLVMTGNLMVDIFGTPLHLDMAYDTTHNLFNIEALPDANGSILGQEFLKHLDLSLHNKELRCNLILGAKVGGADFDFPVTIERGFPDRPELHISHIGDLPHVPMKAAVDKIRDLLNTGSGKCEEILSDWMDVKVSVSARVDPDQGIDYDSGNMPLARNQSKINIPMLIEYNVHTALGSTGDDIPFHVVVDLPTGGMDTLPQAIWQSLLDSGEGFASAMLSNKKTYKAITEAIIAKKGSQAAAAFVCRALQKLLEELKKAIEAIPDLVAKLLHALAELASIFGIDIDEDSAKRQKRKQLVDRVRKEADKSLGKLDVQLDKLKHAYVIKNAKLKQLDSGKLELDWIAVLKKDAIPIPDIAYEIALVKTKPNGNDVTVQSDQILASFRTNDQKFIIPWDTICDVGAHDLYICVRVVLPKSRFMNAHTRENLSDQKSTLQGDDYKDFDSSKFLIKEITDRLTEFDYYNAHGLAAKTWAVAQVDKDLLRFVIGKSRLGLVSRLS